MKMYDKQQTRHQNDDAKGFATSEVKQRLESLKAVTQETRFTLIQNILCHPKQQPSLKELSYVNQDKSKSTIREHLGKLIDHGIVEKTELSKGERSRDLPHQFYKLTGEGYEFLREQGLLEAEETLQELYSRVEKSPDVRKYEEAPRPESKDSNDVQDSERLLQP